MTLIRLILYLILCYSSLHGGVPPTRVTRLAVSGVDRTNTFVYQVDCHRFTSVNDALDSIGTVNATTLIVSDSQSITGNTVIPSNVFLEVTKSGVIDLPSARTIHIDGKFSAGPYPAFTNAAAGDVTFDYGAVECVYPEWWGAKGDASTMNTTAIQCAIQSLPDGGTVRILEGDYHSNTFTINEPIILQGLGIGSKLTQKDSTSFLRIANSNVAIRDLNIIGQVGVLDSLTSGEGTISSSGGIPLSDVKILNNTISGNQEGIIFANGFSVDSLRIEGNIITSLIRGVYLTNSTFVKSGNCNRICNNTIVLTNKKDDDSIKDSYAGIQCLYNFDLHVNFNNIRGGWRGIEILTGTDDWNRDVECNYNSSDTNINFLQVQNGSCSYNMIDPVFRPLGAPGIGSSYYGTGGGLEVGAIREVSVIGNVIKNQDGNGIDDGGGTIFNSNISDNIIYNVGEYGIQFSSHITDSKVCGNIIRKVGKDAIRAVHATRNFLQFYRMSVSWNTIDSVDQDGINVDWGDDITLSHNIITRVNMVDSNYYGIRQGDYASGGQSHNIMIDHNNIQGGKFQIWSKFDNDHSGAWQTVESNIFPYLDSSHYGVLLNGIQRNNSNSYVSASPASETWYKGDIIYNTNPTGTTPPSWMCIFRFDTQTKAGASSGATSVDIDAVTGVYTGDIIGVEQDDFTIRWTTITNVPDSDTITLTDALTDDVAIDNYVYIMRMQSNGIPVSTWTFKENSTNKALEIYYKNTLRAQIDTVGVYEDKY